MGFEVGYVFPNVPLTFQIGPMKAVILLPALLGSFVLLAAVSTEPSLSQEADLFRNEGLFQETAMAPAEGRGISSERISVFELSKAWTIGEADDYVYGGLPLHKIRDVVVGPDGSVFVSDGGNARILIFDANGQWKTSFGRQGEGPGEFISLSKLAVDDGMLYALDSRLRRISIFSTTGTFLHSFSIREMAADVAVSGSHVYISYFSPARKEALVVVYDTSGVKVSQLGTPLPSTVEVNRAGEAGRVALADEGIYYAFAYPYRIERLSLDGQQQQVIALEKKRFQLPTAGETYQGKRLGGTLSTRIRGIGTLGQGTLVVQVNYDEQVPELDFISTEGKLVQSIELPDEHQLGDVSGDNLYTFVHGANEVQAMVTKWFVKHQ